MTREYHRWYSDSLHKQMELLVFGNRGAPVIFFPTRTAHFYDYEDWNIIDALAHKIDAGYLQVFCVDSNDIESFYNKNCYPHERLTRHLHYENYIINEVLPLVRLINNNPFIIAAGCSLGAYHAVNISFKYPHIFKKVVGISGRYDLTFGTKKFPDLFDGYRDEAITYNMPTQYVPLLNHPPILEAISRLDIHLAVGKLDPFAGSNIHLYQALHDKGVHAKLDLWEGEAHRKANWRQIVPTYL